MKLDATTVEVIKGALIYTAEEMGISLRKSAYSPNIKERMDHSCAIFDHHRRLVAQAEHIPVHLGSMALAVREGLDQYEGTLKEGDMLLFNDPYISGTHLPDLTLIAPIFHGNNLLGYSTNKAHHTDVGGKAPGSIAGDASELYQEGLIIPPVKFVREGKIDSEISSLIKSNVRTPDIQLGDLRAQIAANNTGIRRVKQLIDEHGIENFQKSMETIMDYSEHRMRTEITAMPEGVYEAEDWMEDTGTDDIPVKINVKITIEKSSISFNYDGTSPQVDGPVNAPLGVTLAGVFYTLVSITDPTIPVNDGCFRPISLNVPKGCMMNPKRPAPVAGGNVETSQRNVDVLMKAFALALPGKIPAASQGSMNNISIGGIRDDGTPWTFYETIAGGNGGRPESDGVDGIHVHMTNTMNTPIEALEAYLPLRFEAYSFRPDSGGPGKWRGGCGVIRSWALLSKEATLSILAERNKIHPWGLQGGSPGSLGEYLLKKRSGDIQKLPSKCTIRINNGDTLIIRTPGGGGYGDPLIRDPKYVQKDVEAGLVSLDNAEKFYGVILDEKSMTLLEEATEALRKSIRKSQ
jgi:N-methylhydantoinase B